GLPAALLATGAVTATVPRSLAAATTKAAVGEAAVSAQVAALVSGSLRALTPAKLKTVAAAFLVVGLTVLGAAAFAPRPPAAAPGCGLGWESFDPDAERPEATVRLGAEQVIRGQLRDLQGQPAAKVPLQLVRVARLQAKEELLAKMRAAEKERAMGNNLTMR